MSTASTSQAVPASGQAVPASSQAVPASSQAVPASRQVVIVVLSIALAYVTGATINWLPVTYSKFQQEFSAGLEAQGRTFGLFYVGGIVMPILAGWLTNRLGFRRAAVGALFLLSAGMALIGGAPVFSLLLVGCFLFGSGNSWLMTVFSSLISFHFLESRQRLLIWSKAFFNLGALLTLPLVGLWFKYADVTGGWRTAYCGLALLLLAAGVLLLLIFGDWLGRPGAREGEAKVSLVSLLRQSSFSLMSLCALLFTLAQLGLCSWVGQLYRGRLSIDDAQAGVLLGANAAGFLLGLIGLGWLSARRRFRERILFGTGTGGATIVLLALILNQNYYVAVALMVLEGIVMAGCTPALYSFVGSRFPSAGATAFGLLIGLMHIGSAAGPYVIGFLGQWVGSLELAIWVLPAFSCLAAVVSFSLEFQERRLGNKAAECTV